MNRIKPIKVDLLQVAIFYKTTTATTKFLYFRPLHVDLEEEKD